MASFKSNVRGYDKSKVFQKNKKPQRKKKANGKPFRVFKRLRRSGYNFNGAPKWLRLFCMRKSWSTTTDNWLPSSRTLVSRFTSRNSSLSRNLNWKKGKNNWKNSSWRKRTNKPRCVPNPIRLGAAINCTSADWFFSADNCGTWALSVPVTKQIIQFRCHNKALTQIYLYIYSV